MAFSLGEGVAYELGADAAVEAGASAAVAYEGSAQSVWATSSVSGNLAESAALLAGKMALSALSCVLDVRIT